MSQCDCGRSFRTLLLTLMIHNANYARDSYVLIITNLNLIIFNVNIVMVVIIIVMVHHIEDTMMAYFCYRDTLL